MTRCTLDPAEYCKLRRTVTEFVEKLPRNSLMDAYMEIYAGNIPCGDAPKWWDDPVFYEYRKIVLDDAIRYIEDRIPLKERLRHERKGLYGETDEQFAEYWESRWLQAIEKISTSHY